jgi:HSP20 family protein
VAPDRKALWVPHTDVYATEEGLVIKVELAGMKSENLQITTENQSLKISGQRPDDSREGKVNFLVMEINYGPFETILELPAGYDLSHAQASYLNGFLKVEVPLSKASSGKRTKIRIAEK